MTEHQQKLQKLREIIAASDNIVFFGGAGVSTESGIPDFRSVDGLYSQKYDYPPEEILSIGFFLTKAEEFYKFYNDKLLAPNVKPNAAHYALAELERQGKLKAIITQNIDNLHQLAGSSTVLELHGSVYRNFCTVCKKSYDFDYMCASKGVPHCSCGGTIKPDVVLYGENLDSDVLNRSISLIAAADVLIVAGTSLTVYPAAGLIQYFMGRKLVLINKSATPLDSSASLVINARVGEVLQSCIGGE